MFLDQAALKGKLQELAQKIAIIYDCEKWEQNATQMGSLNKMNHL